MAVPFRKISKTRRDMRRTHYKVTANGLVKCPNCGNIITGNFCMECGTKKPEKQEEKFCSNCGAKASENAKFCIECGTKL